ncbi:MAG: dienelactone hydrolase family protein [Dehalococcoidia bacterium]
METRWDEVQSNGARMRCYVTLPATTPAPAVVVIQHAGGVDQFIQSMTERIAEAGFVGIAPDLYHRDNSANADDPLTRMGRLRDHKIIVDVSAAVAHLKSLPEARGDRIGITGFCMGGRVAYLMATQDAEFKAVVVFYGGSIMQPWGDGPAPFDESAKIGAPLLGLFGEQDGNPNPDDVAKIDAALTRLNKPHEFHSYAGVGHAFMNVGRPGYREEVAQDAWQKTVSWFERYLK